jgi:hypothetical protein
VFQSSNNQRLPFTNLDCYPNTKATPALGTRAIHNPQGAADVINRPDPTIQTHLTAGLTTPQNIQETEIYWCIDKIFDEPIKSVFRCIERADQIREDFSFYRQVNHKLRSAGGAGLKGWITPYISWKRVTSVEFIKVSDMGEFRNCTRRCSSQLLQALLILLIYLLVSKSSRRLG